MAVIRYSGLVDQLRGKLNGTVFSRFSAGFNSYKKGQPSRWGSDTQQFMRQGFQEAARLWKSLTAPQRLAWAEIALNSPVANRLGDPALLPAYQYMLKFYQYSRAAGRTFTIAPNTSLEKPPALVIDSAWLDATWQDGSYYISFLEVVAEITAAGDVPGYALVSISQPLDREDSNYNSTYYTVGSQFIASWYEPEDFTWIEPDPTNMPGAWHTRDGAWHRIMIRVITELTAQELPPIFAMVQSNYTPPATPLTYTFSNAADPYGKYWAFTGSAQTYPTYENIFNQTRINEYPPGDPSDYEFITDVLLQAQPTSTPNPSLFDNPYKTFTTPGLWNSANPNMVVTIMPSPAFANWLNTDPRTPNPVDYQWIHTRVKIRRLSDSTESGWSYLQWQPVAP